MWQIGTLTFVLMILSALSVIDLSEFQLTVSRSSIITIQLTLLFAVVFIRPFCVVARTIESRFEQVASARLPSWFQTLLAACVTVFAIFVLCHTFWELKELLVDQLRLEIAKR